MDRWLIEKLRKFIEDTIDEITATGDVAGYSTPFAFKDTDEPGSRKKKKKKMDEELELNNRDVKLLKLIIRDEVAAIVKDIWLKRSAWK